MPPAMTSMRHRAAASRSPAPSMIVTSCTPLRSGPSRPGERQRRPVGRDADDAPRAPAARASFDDVLPSIVTRRLTRLVSRGRTGRSCRRRCRPGRGRRRPCRRRRCPRCSRRRRSPPRPTGGPRASRRPCRRGSRHAPMTPGARHDGGPYRAARAAVTSRGAVPGRCRSARRRRARARRRGRRPG